MVMSVHDIPGTHTAAVTIPLHAAATATERHVIFVAPYACEITGVTIYPGAAVTGANTNTTHLNLINAGTAGTGSTSLATYDLTLGNDLAVAGKALYAPATPLAVSAGNVIILEEEKVGNGLLVPNMRCVVSYRGH